MTTALTQSDFLEKMVEFGFFDRIEGTLPDNFTLVYEIARILEDTNHRITRTLSPIIWNDGEGTPPPRSPESTIIPNIPASEEYEANLIDSYRDIARIYPHQFLLPDTVFYQKLVERSLWMPKPRVPRNYRYQKDANTFAPDSRKQKIYILFDTSRSMQEHFRIHVAKALVYFFLKRNKQELGTIFFRTFDAEIGALHSANNAVQFDELMSFAMHVSATGAGTALSKALETAIIDIHQVATLAETEILVITDGAAHIDAEKIGNLMGENIIVNCVKIGNATIEPDPRFIDTLIKTSSSEQAQQIRKIIERKKDLEKQGYTVSAESRKNAIHGEIAHCDKMIQQLTSRLSTAVTATYGKEIEQLANVFIQVQDINAEEIFGHNEERKQTLEALAKEMVDTLQNSPSAEDLKRAAIIFDHIKLFTDHSNDAENQSLDAINKELKSYLDKLLAESTQKQMANVEFSEDDKIQISKLLQSRRTIMQRISLMKLLRILYKKLRRTFIRFRQKRRYKV